MTDKSQSLEHFTPEALALHIAAVALEKKALNLEIIDVRGRASYTDFIVICSGRNDRHVMAISDAVARDLRPIARPRSVEGKAFGHWILMDYHNVILHIFYGPERSYYAIEQIWADAPRLELEIPESLKVDFSMPYEDDEAFSSLDEFDF